MRGVDAALVLSFQNRVRGDLGAVLEDPNLMRMVLDLDDALSGRVRDAVVIAVDRDHTLVTDPSLDGQHGAIRDRRQHRQARLFFGKGLVHDAPGGSMNPRVGDHLTPAVELGVQIVEIPESPRQEEVLPNVAERPFDLAQPSGPDRPDRPVLRHPGTCARSL